MFFLVTTLAVLFWQIFRACIKKSWHPAQKDIMKINFDMKMPFSTVSLALNDAALATFLRAPNLWLRQCRSELSLFLMYSVHFMSLWIKALSNLSTCVGSMTSVSITILAVVGWRHLFCSVLSGHHNKVGFVTIDLQAVCCQVVGHDGEFLTQLDRQLILVLVWYTVSTVICLHYDATTGMTRTSLLGHDISLTGHLGTFCTVDCLWEIICKYTIDQGHKNGALGYSNCDSQAGEVKLSTWQLWILPDR